jgi:hypothetical protein
MKAATIFLGCMLCLALSLRALPAWAVQQSTGWGNWKEEEDSERPPYRLRVCKNFKYEWESKTDGNDATRLTPKALDFKDEGKLMLEEGPYYRTTDKWKSFTMTIEYRTLDTKAAVPTPAFDKGIKPPDKDLPIECKEHDPKKKTDLEQFFGNSGIYVYDRYEVQIIDLYAFDNKKYGPGSEVPAKLGKSEQGHLTPGTMYSLAPNKTTKNWGKKTADPTKIGDGWNLLKLVFCAPTLNGTTITQAAKAYTKLNGTPVFEGELKTTAPLNSTGTTRRKGEPPLAEGYIYLQSHWGSQVEFKNPSITEIQGACPPP